jgi:DNA-binding protein Fis
MENEDKLHLHDECMFLADRGKVYRLSMERLEKELIEKALLHSNGNQLLAAKILGVNRNTLRAKIKKLGIDPNKWKI